jgi:MoxR-like ATPase
VDDHTYPLPQPFMVLATQNPIEHHGTYPLPESQLDRFMLRIRMGYPSRETEKEILRSRTGVRSAENAAVIEAVTEAGDVVAMQEAVENVRVDDSLLDYAVEIAERTRQNERLTLGASPRGSLMLQRAAQARAFIAGRDYCLPDDFKKLVIPVFAHRLVVNTRFATTQKKSAQAESILGEILEETRVPV